LNQSAELITDDLGHFDEDGYLVEYNHYFSKMLGYEYDNMIGMHVSEWDAVIPKEEIKNYIDMIFRNDGVTLLETKHRKKNSSFVGIC
jgi:PAS domain S-box-containing protein